MRALGVPVLVADARLTETLEALNIAEARCLVVMTNDDLANMETALNARALKPDLRVVLRLFDHDLALRVERAFGIHISRSPSALAAPAFAASAEGRLVVGTIPVGAGALVVARTPVEFSPEQHDRTVADLEGTAEARVLALLEGGQATWRPSPGTPLRPGMEVVVVASRTGLAQLLATAEPGAGTLHDRNHREG